MILEISIDPATKTPTVEGDDKHKLGTKGGGMLLWRCEPDQGHQGWEVEFEESPFVSKKTKFSGTDKPDGDRLAKRNKKDGDKNFKYSVSCTDSRGNKREADPEVIIWPSVR